LGEEWGNFERRVGEIGEKSGGIFGMPASKMLVLAYIVPGHPQVTSGDPRVAMQAQEV